VSVARSPSKVWKLCTGSGSPPAFALGYVQNGCDTPGRQRSEGFPCEAVS
jgi:hypothetical protein